MCRFIGIANAAMVSARKSRYGISRRSGTPPNQKTNACIGRYTFPVNRRIALITAFVELAIRCETKPRSTPNCEPNRGRTISSPIIIIIP